MACSLVWRVRHAFFRCEGDNEMVAGLWGSAVRALVFIGGGTTIYNGGSLDRRTVIGDVATVQSQHPEVGRVTWLMVGHSFSCDCDKWLACAQTGARGLVEVTFCTEVSLQGLQPDPFNIAVWRAWQGCLRAEGVGGACQDAQMPRQLEAGLRFIYACVLPQVVVGSLCLLWAGIRRFQEFTTVKDKLSL